MRASTVFATSSARCRCATPTLGSQRASNAPKIAVDLTTLTSPFWTSYNKYIVEEAEAQGIDLLEPFNSEFDTAKQITGVQNAIQLGAKGIIFSPFDSAAAGTVLKTAEKAGVAVVAVDVAPTTGPVAIVVRADNVAYGEKACQYIGEHVAEGPVVQIMGDFQKGDIIQLVDESGKQIGLGIAEYNSAKALERLGQKNQKALVHYDYLFLNPEMN